MSYIERFESKRNIIFLNINTLNLEIMNSNPQQNKPEPPPPKKKLGGDVVSELLNLSLVNHTYFDTY